eukprot:TRINITY_DN94969_c0_g1_i1.p1 TRINITY_DN94969_c0_g1~~TRINITY_DN94969_c0_g1_i1.p1  ORF type:complete len:558 (+),score=169.34 TRINITY_DN94969_c0_g1_i1:100-1773(+)
MTAHLIQPKQRSEAEIKEDTMAVIQKFLDDWHHSMVYFKIAKTWGRARILGTLLDVLALHGLPMPAGGKEVLLKGDESAVVAYLFEHMPERLRESFEEISAKTLQVVQQLLELRGHVEAGDAEQAAAAFEGGREESQQIGNKILRQTIEHAAGEAGRLRLCHDSWRGTTEARIERLNHAADEAEAATQALLTVEARIAAFRSTQSEKARLCLISLASASTQALTSSCFAGWRGCCEEGKAERQLRQQYEAKLEEMQQEYLRYQESRISNVANTMRRLGDESAVALLTRVFDAWRDDWEQSRRVGDSTKQLEEAQQQFLAVQQETSVHSKKVIASMLLGDGVGYMALCFHAWVQFSSDFKKEQCTERAVDDLKQKLKAAMDVKKNRMVHLLRAMVDSQAEDLLHEIMQLWAEHTQEEKRMSQLDDEMCKSNAKLTMLKSRQLRSAHGVRERINKQTDLVLLSVHMMAWMMQTKVVRLNMYYTKKLDTKRKQLVGVQNLFHSFASQIEANLDVEDDDNDLKQKPQNSHDHSQRKSKGMKSHGTVSLPSINSKPAYRSLH